MKNIRVRIFLPGNKRSNRRVISAPSGKTWNDHGVESILHKLADNLEKQFPGEEFRLVPLGDHDFNFVHDGPRVG